MDIDYESCLASELPRCVIARLGKLPPRCSRRVHYIKCLRKEDAEPSNRFRFLEPPPELRTSAYRKLLNPARYDNPPFTCAGAHRRLRRTNSLRYLQVLRTSKEVYEEALEVLYEQVLVEIHLGGFLDETCVAIQPCDIKKLEARGTETLLDTVFLPECTLQKARYLDIHIDLIKPDDFQIAKYPHCMCNMRLRQLNMINRLKHDSVLSVSPNVEDELLQVMREPGYVYQDREERMAAALKTLSDKLDNALPAKLMETVTEKMSELNGFLSDLKKMEIEDQKMQGSEVTSSASAHRQDYGSARRSL